MQDHHRQFDEIFLQRTAGPYIGVKRVGLTMRRSLPVLPYERQHRSACLKGANNRLTQRSK
jgi:hypothetical protein